MYGDTIEAVSRPPQQPQSCEKPRGNGNPRALTTLTQASKRLDFNFVNGTTGIITLSIGGNDVKFSTSLKKCVYGDKGCTEQLDASRKILYGKDLFNDYMRLVQIIMGYTGWNALSAVSDP